MGRNNGQALLVIDVQQGMAAGRAAGYPWANAKAEARIADLIAGFRGHGLPVIHVHHHDLDPADTMHADAPGSAVLPCAIPAPGEALFIKHGSSAFICTALEQHLRDNGINALTIAGGEANYCVESTSRMAGDLGFHPLLAEDALINFQKTLRDGRVLAADQVLAVVLATLAGSFARVACTAALLADLDAA